MNTASAKITAMVPEGVKQHKIVMINRRELSCEGITEIVGYNETEAILDTAVGRLVIGGNQLTISSLSVDTGNLKVFGNISFVEYKGSKQEGFFKRMMR